jgi:zeaxanthin glucosyltransferase
MTALGHQLQARHHDVVFLYSSGATGLPFIPGPEKDHIIESIPEASKMQGDDSLEFGIRILLAQTETILKSLPAIVHAHGIDALILDTVQFYAELKAIQLGIPYIHVSNALHFGYSGHTPLSIYGWPHQATKAALARNRKGVAKFTSMLGRWNGGVRTYAERFRLKIDWEDPGSTLSPLASITQVRLRPAYDGDNGRWRFGLL